MGPRRDEKRACTIWYMPFDAARSSPARLRRAPSADEPEVLRFRHAVMALGAPLQPGRRPDEGGAGRAMVVENDCRPCHPFGRHLRWSFVTLRIEPSPDLIIQSGEGTQGLFGKSRRAALAAARLDPELGAKLEQRPPSLPSIKGDSHVTRTDRRWER